MSTRLFKTRSYRSFVAERAQRNLYLQNLRNFLQNDAVTQHTCHIACLEFFAGNGSPSRQNLSHNGLASILENQVTGKNDLCGRLLIIEDVSKEVVETLGSRLNIDPFFFASHMDTSEFDVKKTRLQTATLASTKRSQNFVNLHYYRVIEFEHLESEKHLLRDMNVPRKVKILAQLTQLKGINLGLARHCCSVLMTEGKDGLWLGKRVSPDEQLIRSLKTQYLLGLVLVDAPMSNSYRVRRRDNGNACTLILQTQLFQGGFLDFLPGPSFSENIDSQSGAVKSSQLETLIYYWTLEQPQGFNVKCPTLFSLSSYPLRIAAAEWVIYSELMHHSIKQYEYSPDAVLSLGHIEVLTADIFALQQWARRNIATARKIRYAIDFLRGGKTTDKEKEYSALIREDFEQIALNVAAYGHRLETLVSVATSLVQAIDCRRSLRETISISRLTYLALAFIPLTFVSGLFGMNDSIAPGGKIFGLYFAVSIPLCMLVFLIVHPPTGTPLTFAARIWRSKALQKNVVK